MNRPNIKYSSSGIYKQAIVNNEVKVWLSSVHNKNDFTTSIITDVPYVKESHSEFTLTPDDPGQFKIEVHVTAKDKSIVLISNTLVLIVIDEPVFAKLNFTNPNNSVLQTTLLTGKN